MLENIKHQIFITEKNVNGCGDYANTMAEFDRALSPGEISLFQKLLADIKGQAAIKDECLDTDDMVQAALEQFRDIATGYLVPIADYFIEF